MNRHFCLIGASIALLAASPAGAQTSGIIFAGNVTGPSRANAVFDSNPLHSSTRCADAKHGLSYGIIDWPAQTCTAGRAARLAKYNSANDDYERLGHWGRGSDGADPFRFIRGLVRYDADTFLVLSSQPMLANANGVQAPSLFQVQYRAQWFDANQPQTDDQYIQGATMVNHMVRAAPRPFELGIVYQWGPGPPDPNMPGPPDWSWCGGGTTGKLQFADATQVLASWQWPWDNDWINPPYFYVTGLQSTPNHKMVDSIYGLPRPGNLGTLYQAEQQAPGAAEASTALGVAIFYGQTENIIYTTQMEGRIYKLVGAKELGYRRRAGQPAPGAKVTGYAGTEPVLTPNNRYAVAFDSGAPIVGDDPNDVPPAPHGRGITSTELFSDAGHALGRHYVGLAADAGGRVYAVSERIVDSVTGKEPAPIHRGTGADVYNGGGGGPFTIDDPAAPFDGVNIVVGDLVVLISGTGINPGPIFTITAVWGTTASLDADPGDSLGEYDVGYRVYPAGTSPRGELPGAWTSEAILDVYQSNGTLASSIDLNDLVRPDGVALSDCRYDAQLQIPGIIVHGDVEVDPTIWGGNKTRLWIICAGGDGDPATNDGLDLLAVDLVIDLNGCVSGVSFVGGVDDADLPLGQFYQGNYSSDGWDPFGLWVCYGDLEFDGSDNLVYMGGGGDTANSYAGVTAAELAAVASAMEAETAAGQDAVVGINAFNLDMDLYGFGTDFGLAFDNSPLTNVGWPRPCCRPPNHLLISHPPADGTLPRTKNNCILLVFDGPITLPGGPALSIINLHDSTDVSASFTYTLEQTSVPDDTLKARENNIALVNQKWYRVTEGAGLNAYPFAVDLCTLQGDVDGDGCVLAQDYFPIKLSLFWPSDCDRWDPDGNGTVLAQDYFIVKNHLFQCKPPKP